MYNPVTHDVAPVFSSVCEGRSYCGVAAFFLALLLWAAGASDAVANASVDTTPLSAVRTVAHLSPKAAFAANTAPRVQYISRLSPQASPTSADTLTWEVRFDIKVKDVDAADFEVRGTTATLSVIKQSFKRYWVRAAGGDLTSLDGTVELAFSASQDIKGKNTDALLVNTAVVAGGLDERTWEVDHVPSVEIRGVPEIATGPFVATFAFSEPVLGFTASDLSLTAAEATEFSGADDMYTATITCSGEGAYTVGVAAGVALDANGNANTAAATRSGTCKPALRVLSIARHDPASSPTRADTLTWKVTFSEAVRNVDASDFTVTGAGLGAVSIRVLSAGGATAYTVEASGGNLSSFNAEATLAFAAGQNIETLDGVSLLDVTPVGTSEHAYLLDNTPATLTIAGVPDPLNGSSVATFAFDEPVSGFTLEDIALLNLAAGKLSGSGDAWTLSVSCIADGPASVRVGANAASDRTGNGSTSASVSATCNAAPRVASIQRESPAISPTNADTLTWVVKFNEKVRNVDASDFEVAGTTASLALLPPSGQKAYRIRITGGDLAHLNGRVSLSFASGQDITDREGARLADTEPVSVNEATYVVDNAATPEGPRVQYISRLSPQASPTSADTLTWEVRFDVKVKDVDAADFEAHGTTATLAIIKQSFKRYWIRIAGGDLPSLDGTVELAFSASQDIKGKNTDALLVNTAVVAGGLDERTWEVDHVPSVEIRGVPATATGPFVATFAFSEPVLGFTASDLSLTAAEASEFSGADDMYTATITCSGEGTFTVGVAAGVVLDANGNANTAAATRSGTCNPALRVLSIARHDPVSSPTRADTLTWKVTFSEAVRNVDASDFTVTGAGLGAVSIRVLSAGSASAYTVEASGGNLAGLDATVTLAFAAGQNIETLDGVSLLDVTPVGTSEHAYLLDNTPATLTIAGVPDPLNGSSVATFAFDEPVSGFTLEDIALANLAAGKLSGSGDAWTLSVSCIADGPASVRVGANAASDRVGNGSTSASVSATCNAAPRVASIKRESPSISPTNADTLTWVVKFNEKVRNVDASDFEVTGTTASLALLPPSGQKAYRIRIAGGDLTHLNGRVSLSFASGQDITDRAGARLADTEPVNVNEATYAIDNEAPALLSIVRHIPPSSPTAADTLTWRVTFSEGVEGVDAFDFILDGTTAKIFVVSGEPGDAVYEIQAAGGDLAGLDATVTLAFEVEQDITDLAGHAFVDTPPSGADERTYVLRNITDATAPRVSSLERRDPVASPTQADTLIWRVTFNEAVEGVDASDFTLAGTTATLSVASGEAGDAAYEIQAAGGDLAGLNAIVTLGFAAGQNIQDLAGNALADPSDTGTYEVDNTAPALLSIVRHVPPSSPTAADTLTWRVTFSEGVEGVDAFDFTLTVTTATLSIVSGVSGDAVYEIQAAGGDLAGLDATVTLAFEVEQDITDLAGHAFVDTPPSGADERTYVLRNVTDATAPRVSSLERRDPVASPTQADTLIWRVTFNEAVEEVDAGDFTLAGTTATLSVASGEAGDAVYEIQAAGGDLANLDATVTLGFAPGQDIQDLAGNALADPSDTGTYEVDNAAPALSSIVRSAPEASPTKADELTWRVTFNESVTGVDAGDFTLTGTTATLSVTGGRAIYDVKASGGDLADLNATATLGFVAGQNITDLAGNALPTPADTKEYVVDNEAPALLSIVRHVPPSSPTTADTLTWRVTFSEDVAGVDAGDFTLTGTTATLSVVSGVSGDAVYEIQAAGGDLAGLDATVTLAFEVEQDITDLAGHAFVDTPPSGADERTYVLRNITDATAPRVSSLERRDPVVSPTAADTLTWRVTFSEDVEGVDAGDFTLAGTTATLSVASGVAGDATYEIQAAGGDLANLDATVTLGFAPGQDIQDLAGNALANPSDTGTYEVDNAAPALSSIARSAPATSPTKADELTWKVTFGESVAQVDADDFTVTGTTAKLFVTGGPAVYDVKASGGNLAGLDATVTLGFDSGQNIKDLAGNALPTPADTKGYEVDNAAPTLSSIARSAPATSPTKADELTWKVTFEESVAQVDADDFTLAGTTAKLFVTGGPAVYDVKASGGDLADLNATVTLGFDSGQNIKDLAGNALPTPADTKGYEVDNAAPTLSSIARSTPATSPTKADELTWKVTFEESVAQVDADDFTVTGTTAKLFVTGGPAVYDVKASGGNLAGLDATVTLGFDSGQNITDIAGNALSTPADTKEYEVDNTAPTLSSIALSAPSSSRTNANTLTWKVTFSESVAGIDEGDFTVTGTTAKLAVTGSPAAYDVKASGGDLADLNATVTLGFDSRQNITDIAGNALSTPADTKEYEVDNTAPTLSSIALSAPSSSRTNANTLTWKVTFSESVAGIDEGDFTVTGTTAKLAVTGDLGVYDVKASGGDLADLNATVTLGFDSGQNIMDLAGNALSTPADTKEYEVDNTAPTLSSIALSAPSSSRTNANTLTWKVTFSESVAGIDGGDFTVTGTTAKLAVTGGLGVYDVKVSGGDLAGLDATVTLGFDSRQNIKDLAGNALSTPTDTKAYVVDNASPTLSSIARSTPSSSRTNANTLTWKVTFSESVAGVDMDDFTVTGTTARLSVTGGPTTYNVKASGGNLTGLNATVTLRFSSAPSIVDRAGNALRRPTDTKDYVVDNAAPWVSSITRTNRSPTKASSLAWTVKFDESVTEVDAGDFTVTGTSANLSVNGSGSIYQVKATSVDNSLGQEFTVTLKFAVGHYITDWAGNSLRRTKPIGENDPSYIVDTTAPKIKSITRHDPSFSRTKADILIWKVTFDEKVKGVEMGDFMRTGSTTKPSVSTSDSIAYLVTASESDLEDMNGTVTLMLASGHGITDLAGNKLNTKMSPNPNHSYVVDNKNPKIESIARHNPKSSRTKADILTWKVTFDEKVKGIEMGDFMRTGSTTKPSVSTSDSIAYLVTASESDLEDMNGTVTLILASGHGITDLAGNKLNTKMSPNPNHSYVVDNKNPELKSIARHNPKSSRTKANTLIWKVTFDEKVKGVEMGDFMRTGSTTKPSVSTSDSIAYLVTASESDLKEMNGTVTLTLASGHGITDLAGNKLNTKMPPDPNHKSYVVDNKNPELKSIARHKPKYSPTNADSLIWKVTFTEDVTGVGPTNFMLSGTTETLSVRGEGSIYYAKAQGGNLASLNGEVTLKFASVGGIRDSALNDLEKPPQTISSYVVDNIHPRVTVSGMPKPFAHGREVKLTFTFGERVTDFSARDLSLQNASLVVDFTPGSQKRDCAGDYCKEYDVWVTTSARTGAHLLVTLPAESVTDAAGNGNVSRSVGSIVSGGGSTIPPPHLSVSGDSTLSPSVTSIEREPLEDAPSRLSVLSWRVRFSEAVQRVDADDFTFAGAPDSAHAAAYLLEEGVYRVALSGVGPGRTGGSVTLAFASDQDIENLSGVPLTSVTPTGVNDPVHVLNASLSSLSATRSAPSFEQEAYAFSLPENRSGPYVLGQVTAHDPAGAQLTYVLAGSAEAPFSLDAASGEVRYTGSGEDYEAGPVAYAFTAEAARAEGARARASVVVTVTDVNEAPQALGAPALLSLEAGGAPAQEDMAAYFLDPDADALSFASASSSEPVASTRMAGGLLAVTPLSIGQAIVTVTATDAGGLQATIDVAVSVSASSSERARTLRTSLSALGRTMGSEAVEMVTTRLEDAKAGAHMRLGGETLSCRSGCKVAPVVRLASQLAGISSYGYEQGASPRNTPGLGAPLQPRGQRTGMSGDALLRGSAFRFSDAGGDLSRGWTFWGRGAAGRFRGKPVSGLSLSGRTWSGYAGADYRLKGGAVAGVALSRTAGDIEITSALNGASDAAVRMTSVMPYGRWYAGRGLSFWGLAGGGRGVSELTEASGDLFRTDLFMTTGAVGASQSLGQRFSLQADAFRVRIRSEETQGLAEVTGTSHRIRLSPSWKMSWTRGASRLHSSLSAGARFDGGDAERGLGAEAGLAAGYAHTPSGIALDAKTRMLLVHEEEGFREWGASVSFKVNPGGASGVSLSVKPAWGSATSRVQDLWGGQTALREWAARSSSGSERRGFSPERLDVEAGYGIVSVRGKKVTPFGRWTRDALGGSRLDVGAKASLPAGKAAAAPRTLDVSFNRESKNLTLRAVWPLADR